MELKFTVKIKDEQNPPVFNEELGKGVLATQVAEFPTVNTKEDLESPMFQQCINEFMEKLKNEWCEVTVEVVNKNVNNLEK